LTLRTFLTHNPIVFVLEENIFMSYFLAILFSSKASLCYGSESWIINKRDDQKLGSAQTGILRPLLVVERLDHQRNPDIRNRLKVDNTAEDVKLYQNNWLDRLKRTDRSRLPRLTFQYQPRGRQEMGRPRRRWRDQAHLEL
jgi:hypothetical protein